jgi:diguanylate cyclase (GGDEF)-like protein
MGDPVLTALVRLAQQVTGAASAAIHVFDAEHQRRIAAVGAPLGDYPAEDSLCRVVVESGTRLVTSDATAEERLRNSPFVRDPYAPVRFYASLPLTVGASVAVGTLCAFDSVSRELSDSQLDRMQDLAFLTQAHLELQKVATELGEVATLDPLTGAVNRVIFDDRLALTLTRSRRRGTQALIAVVDIDDFKSLNDTYGHAKGDEALRRVAAGLKQCLRGEDTVGRLGGDEFGLIAEVSGGDVGALLDRVSHAADGVDPPCTLSVGAVIAEEYDDARSVLERADAEMYTTKRTHVGSRIRRHDQS